MINLHIPVHVFDEVKPPSSLKSIHLITKIFFIYSVYIPLRPLTRIDVQCIFSVYPSFSISKLNNKLWFFSSQAFYPCFMHCRLTIYSPMSINLKENNLIFMCELISIFSCISILVLTP